jgi:hypothetical protein
MTDITDITTRRNFLTVAGGLAATIATSLAIAASPGACMAPDPVHAAIATHKAAARMLDAVLAERHLIYKPGDVDAPEFDQGIVDAEREAARLVVNTVPTTRAGLQALEEHLANDRSSLCWFWIRNQIVTDEEIWQRYRGEAYFSAPVARFVERRAAELG